MTATNLTAFIYMKVFSFQNVLLIVLLTFFSCKEKKWDVPTEGVDLELSLERFDLKLLELAEGGISEEEIKQLLAAYPKLYPLYVQNIMKFGQVESSQTVNTLNEFVANKDIKELFETVAKIYPASSLVKEKKQLELGFKRYLVHFPHRSIPNLRTMVAAFNFSTVTADSLLVIGLDNYLGKDFELYSKIGIPAYKFEKFSKEFIVTDAMKGWIFTEFENDEGLNMLEQMIYQGKVLYLVEALLPDIAPWIKFNYFEEELNWCEENESEIWFHFVDMELLYTVENFKIKKYLGDAPFISGFPEGSPGRVGQWIGYKIVASYMKNNPKKNLSDLMKNTNVAQFLQESNYKPKRK